MPRRSLLTFMLMAALLIGLPVLLASFSAHPVQAIGGRAPGALPEAGSIQPQMSNCGVEASYQGYDNVHLSYQTGGCGVTGPIDLVATSGGSQTTLASNLSGSGSFHHIGLSQGQTIDYSLYHNGSSVWGGLEVILDGHLEGTLLFGETVENRTLTGYPSEVIVPDGMNFSMRGSTATTHFDLQTTGSGVAHIYTSAFNGNTFFYNKSSSTDLAIYVQDSQFTDIPFARGAFHLLIMNSAMG